MSSQEVWLATISTLPGSPAAGHPLTRSSAQRIASSAALQRRMSA
jgi:hypothetical protein